MAKKKWMAKAFAGAHGQLRKKLGAKKGQPIAAGKLAKATHSRSTTTKRQAVLAETARKANRGRKKKSAAQTLYGGR
jgi:hypothetical protein